MLPLFVGCVGATPAIRRDAPTAVSYTPAEYRRAEEQSFLTYPEWFLVFSPDEFAQTIREGRPSQFPFFGHIGQYWQGYHTINAATRNYPTNVGYRVMDVVIGTSTTVEYGLRGAYEKTLGRAFELSRRHGLTDEDRFSANVAQDYVDFIRLRPWYEFHFTHEIKDLWGTTHAWGNDPLRKWERKVVLTSEYSFKAIYGWLMEKGTHAAYAAESDVTAVVVESLPDDVSTWLPDLHILSRPTPELTLATLPRYEPFTRCANILAAHGVRFREIAGNTDNLLVTAIVPMDWDSKAAENPFGQELLRQPIYFRPAMERRLWAVKVSELHRVIPALSAPAELEHVYDY